MTARAVLVVCADGSEDIELACITDTLRRAKITVTLATTNATTKVTLARGLKVEADALLEDVEDATFDAVVLPGGMPGATNLAQSETLKAVLLTHSGAGAVIGAICASPAVVLEAHGLIGSRRAVAYPAFTHKLQNAVPHARVCVDGTLVTSAGPGTSIEFALAIVEQLTTKALADEIAGQMLVTRESTTE
jgi:4-methyl-5(b-hydroxyethyl)-thiazole monophosphate biosynthesis